MSAAPSSSTSDSATWLMTKALRSRPRPGLSLERAASFRLDSRLLRESCRAGAMPNSTPVTTEAVRANSRTGNSRRTSAPPIRSVAEYLRTASMLSQARATAAARQQQVGDIGAGDQQDESHGSHEHQERCAGLRAEQLVQRLDFDTLGDAFIRIGVC